MEPMRGDAFIHFVCGSRRVNIQLGVLLLIPKSPQIKRVEMKYFLEKKKECRSSLKRHKEKVSSNLLHSVI